MELLSRDCPFCVLLFFLLASGTVRAPAASWAEMWPRRRKPGTDRQGAGSQSLGFSRADAPAPDYQLWAPFLSERIGSHLGEACTSDLLFIHPNLIPVNLITVSLTGSILDGSRRVLALLRERQGTFRMQEARGGGGDVGFLGEPEGLRHGRSLAHPHPSEKPSGRAW